MRTIELTSIQARILEAALALYEREPWGGSRTDLEDATSTEEVAEELASLKSSIEKLVV
jgi:hypothetical protein